MAGMENKQIARILRETARLLEIDGAIIGRYRSYEKAAELIDGLPESVEAMIATPEKLTELPGIGDRMVEHLKEIVETGDYSLRKKLLKKYPETILDLLELQSLGPKKVAVLWKTFKAGTVADVEKLAKEGKLRDLAGFGEKSEQNILKAVEVFKKSSGRFLLSTAEEAAAAIAAHIQKVGKAVESVTPAGSLRRGKETVGDLDLLVTMGEESGEWRVASGENLEDRKLKLENRKAGGKGKSGPPQKVAATEEGKGKPKNAGRQDAGATRQEMVDAVAKHILTYEGIDQVLAHGENKVSFTLKDGLQVDVRLLEKENFGAALLYFTGSKEHNVALRGRANEMGYTLNEYELATLEKSGEWLVASGEKSEIRKLKVENRKAAEKGKPKSAGRQDAGATGGRRVAGRTEEEIYGKLKLEFIPPELRENTGEIAAAEAHKLPNLIELRDIKGDLQMHTTASDGKNSIEEMAEAARELGHEYIAITDHSKAVTVANGLDEKRMAAHIKKIHAANEKGLGIRVLAGAEVDILKDGSLDYSDELLAQLDVVVCSIHSYFNLERAAMTERMLAAIENPYAQIIGHPTGRVLLRREPLDYDMEKVLAACAKHGVAMECNSYPDRLDLKDVYLRMCKERGVKVVISTDSHNAGNLKLIRYGVRMARRGWLEKKDVINTLGVGEFLGALRGRGKAAKG
jgi:DNA polymerase (family 10)